MPDDSPSPAAGNQQHRYHGPLAKGLFFFFFFFYRAPPSGTGGLVIFFLRLMAAGGSAAAGAWCCCCCCCWLAVGAGWCRCDGPRDAWVTSGRTWAWIFCLCTWLLIKPTSQLSSCPSQRPSLSLAQRRPEQAAPLWFHLPAPCICPLSDRQAPRVTQPTARMGAIDISR